MQQDRVDPFRPLVLGAMAEPAQYLKLLNAGEGLGPAPGFGVAPQPEQTPGTVQLAGGEGRDAPGYLPEGGLGGGILLLLVP